MEGFACTGTAAFDLQMGENQVKNLFVQYSCWKIINILIASSFISESFSEHPKLLFLEREKQSWWAVSSSLKDENREIFGERRKIENFLNFSWLLLLLLWKQNMVSGLSPIISLTKITVREASAAFSPSFPRTETLAPGRKFMPCRGDAAAVPPPARSEGPWEAGVQQRGEGIPGQCWRSPWVGLAEVGASESVLGVATTGDTELRPCRHLAQVKLAALQTQGVSQYFNRKGRLKSFSGEHYSTGEYYSTFTLLLIAYL